MASDAEPNPRRRRRPPPPGPVYAPRRRTGDSPGALLHPAAARARVVARPALPRRRAHALPSHTRCAGLLLNEDRRELKDSSSICTACHVSREA